MIEVMLPPAWITDREERDLPTGDVVRKKGRGVVVRMARADAEEMLSDLRHYASEGMDACPASIVRAARAALPRLAAALA